MPKISELPPGGSLTAGEPIVVNVGGVTSTVLDNSVRSVALGGTGQSAYTDGQLLIGNTATGGLTKATITAGAGITITNGNGSISIAGNSGSGTVTTVSVVTANGLAGTVATSTSTPAITLTTTITGILKGNATAISAATSGTDYSAGTSALATGIIKSTTATGALTIAIAGDFPTLNQDTTGNAATATALKNVRTIGGVNFDGTGNIVPQTIQSVNEATDTTCFPLFINDSGSVSDQPKNNTSFTFNSNTGALGATSFVGAGTGLTGTAASLTAGTVTTNANLTGDVTSSGNATTVIKINGTTLSGLATGLLKNTTSTGVPSIATAGTDYVAPGTVTSFTAQQNFTGVSTVSASNLTAWNLATAQSAYQAMLESTTLSNPTNQVNGGTYVFQFIQNASAAKTLAFGTNYIWNSGGAPTISTTLSSVLILTFVSDGTKMRGGFQQYAS